jgi:hypothetical protein
MISIPIIEVVEAAYGPVILSPPPKRKKTPGQISIMERVGEMISIPIREAADALGKP